MKARKKPIEIEFIPVQGQYKEKILSWSTDTRPIRLKTNEKGGEFFEIETLEGTYVANYNKDVIIRGVRGECYPCKKDIFDETYEITSWK